MVIRIYLSIFLIVLFLFSNEIKAENWIFYSDIEGKGFYDKDSIKNISDKTITVWTKILPTKKGIDEYRDTRNDENELIKTGKYHLKRRKVNDDKLSYQKSLIKINCDSGSYKCLKFIFYNKSNEIIYSSDDDKNVQNDPRNKVHYFKPDAPGYKFYNGVCSHIVKVNKK